MKQLLCDTNSQDNCITESEMNSFRNRFQSVQLSKSDSNIKLSSPSFRDKSYQMANMSHADSDEECYRLRHFSVTGKGVINRGDSFKIGRSRSNSSVVSNGSSYSKEITCAASAHSNTTSPLISSRESSCSCIADAYAVAMLGSSGVGKSSLVNQFMTSEHLHSYDTFIDDELGEKSVSVLLNGEESELTFIDRPNYDIIDATKPHAYCIVYSASDKTSFFKAEKLLQTLGNSSEDSTFRVVILVANKTDLVRSRVVSVEEGMELATIHGCKFIETSVGINHNVDELLVGILTQIRLKMTLQAKLLQSNTSDNSRRKYKRSKTSASFKVKGLLSKVWKTRRSSSQTCVNLQEL